MLLWLSANPLFDQKGTHLNEIMWYWFARAVYCTVIFTSTCPSTRNSLPPSSCVYGQKYPLSRQGQGASVCANSSVPRSVCLQRKAAAQRPLHASLRPLCNVREIRGKT